MQYNPRNVRAGNPDVAHHSETPEPIVERASSKLQSPGDAVLYAATKPKARSTMGFLLSVAGLVSRGEACCGSARLHIGCIASSVATCLSCLPCCNIARTYIAGCVRGRAGSTPAASTNQSYTRQGASANGPAWAAPKRHRHSLPARFAAQPVREGLHKICLPRGDNTATYRQNRGVQRALGLFHPLWVFEIKEPEGEDSSPITLSRALPERK